MIAWSYQILLSRLTWRLPTKQLKSLLAVDDVNCQETQWLRRSKRSSRTRTKNEVNLNQVKYWSIDVTILSLFRLAMKFLPHRGVAQAGRILPRIKISQIWNALYPLQTFILPRWECFYIIRFWNLAPEFGKIRTAFKKENQWLAQAHYWLSNIRFSNRLRDNER